MIPSPIKILIQVKLLTSPLTSTSDAIAHQNINSSQAPQIINFTSPLTSTSDAIAHQNINSSQAPQIINFTSPLTSTSDAIAHQNINSSQAPQTSGFAIAFQTFISNQNNSGAYHVINSDVGIESNGDLPLEVANVLIDLHLNISDPQFIKSQKGKLLLFFQNYIYRYAYQKDDRIHYRCRKVGCKASCKFDGIYTTSGLHEHQNEIGQFEKLRTHKVLEDIVAENPLETRHNIYEKALNKRCLETPSIEMYPEAMPSFVSIKSTIDRLLQKNRPTLPQSLDELVLLPEYITTNKGEIFLINNDNNNNMLVFGTCEMLKLVEICDGDSIYMDGTFYIVPRLYCQLYSIHIMYQEVMILIIYALLPDKNRGTYIELFQIILQFCSMKNI
ncbi:uncharacterized protein LOC135931596 isoform X3 [Gordionus sp. m RMFG-2023]|uniref:uncharacterized protein LOC135931596 isoform X3 n=1 Tax=Gordionus sp. m RMFG-2023 TaxID=3053472 RepID=UPI0031FE20E9